MVRAETGYDVPTIRAEFPMLRRMVHGRPLVYLDSAASAQKPAAVIDETSRFYREDYANVHRGVHLLSQIATEQFEGVRDKVRIVLNAAESDEIVFTKGCTEGINLVAQSWARPRLKHGDQILVSESEHHSNLVPWQIVAEQTGAEVVPIPLLDSGDLDLETFERLLTERVRLVAIGHVSNAIGTVHPVAEMIAVVRQRTEAVVVVDGAQAGPHAAIDVQALDADFYTLSCHKMYAPTGVGILYGKRALLEAMPPYQGGGSMIKHVTMAKTTYADVPTRFEPGTPNIAGFIGFGAALDYLAGLSLRGSERVSADGRGIGWTRADWERSMGMIGAHEARLAAMGRELLTGFGGLRMIGDPVHHAAILSFVLPAAHAHDVGQILDSEGIAVRVGHHCCQPLMQRFAVAATVRASLGLYSDESDLERLMMGLSKVKELFA